MLLHHRRSEGHSCYRHLYSLRMVGISCLYAESIANFKHRPKIDIRIWCRILSIAVKHGDIIRRQARLAGYRRMCTGQNLNSCADLIESRHAATHDHRQPLGGYAAKIRQIVDLPRGHLEAVHAEIGKQVDRGQVERGREEFYPDFIAEILQTAIVGKGKMELPAHIQLRLPGACSDFLILRFRSESRDDKLRHSGLKLHIIRPGLLGGHHHLAGQIERAIVIDSCLCYYYCLHVIFGNIAFKYESAKVPPLN